VGRAVLGSAHVSRADERVLVIANFGKSRQPLKDSFWESLFRRDAAATDARQRPGFQTNIRDARAPQEDSTMETVGKVIAHCGVSGEALHKN